MHLNRNQPEKGGGDWRDEKRVIFITLLSAMCTRQGSDHTFHHRPLLLLLLLLLLAFT